MASRLARLTSKGQFTLPRELREALGVKPGEYVELTQTPEGVLINPVQEEQVAQRVREAEATLNQLVRMIGQELERRGVTEEQLDEWIEEAKQAAHREVYGD